MKIPQTFVKKKDFKKNIEILLNETIRKKAVFYDYNRVRFNTEGFENMLEYVNNPNVSKNGWILAEREFGERKWHACLELNDESKNAIKDILAPAIEFFNLRKGYYSINHDNVQSLIEKCTNVEPQHICRSELLDNYPENPDMINLHIKLYQTKDSIIYLKKMEMLTLF